jgi:ribosomal protein S18 acetylase RimI-like enzyme
MKTTNNLKIVKAKLSDATLLGEVHSLSFRTAYKDIIDGEVLRSFTPEKSAMRFFKVIKEKAEVLYCVKTEGLIIGFGVIGKSRDDDMVDGTGEIWSIYLHPEYSGQGIGSVLMNFLCDKLKKSGFAKVSVWVLEKNEKAVKFYNKHGFKQDGTKDIRISGGDILKEIRLSKPV